MATETSDASGTVTDRLPGGKLTSLLVVAGVVLFLVPEPITSVIGVLVLLAGIAAWIVGRVRR